MNEISLLYNWMIAHFNSSVLVNTITLVDTEEIDFNKENIYPLVNIDFISTNPQEQNILADFEITIIQQRDIKPRRTDSKLLEDSNFIDNINETHSVGLKFLNVLLKQNNSENIEIESHTDLEALKNWNNSGLDGFQFTVSLSIPNEGTSC